MTLNPTVTCIWTTGLWYKNIQFVVFDSSFKIKLGSGTSSDSLSRALMVSTLGIIDSNYQSTGNLIS